jgi:transposase
MELIHRCCAGLDVHKKTVVACVRRVAPDGQVRRQVRTFGTMTADLLALADWLEAEGVRPVAMESTGVYWKPVFHLLEGRFAVLLANARQYRKPPGHKTDVKDAEWLAELHQHGLLKPSFIPPPSIRELRDLTRQRTQLIRDKATVANRVQKVLEDANIKLASVASDPLGVSGRAMLRALIAGQEDPDALAELARGRLRGKIPTLKPALHGRVTAHHRFLLRMLLDQIAALEGLIAQFDAQIGVVLAPFAAAAQRLRTIPGVGQQTAEVIVAEIGADMTTFPSAGHLASWAGLCPGNDQSGGTRRSGRTTKGSQWLRTALVQAAWAASHTKETAFSATYHRWVKRLGKKRALVAVAHKILVVAYHLLKDREDYRERQAPTQAA